MSGEHERTDGSRRHHVNASPIFVALNAQSWLTTAAKVRILEWKIRMDIVQYAARGCPKLPFEQVLSYVPVDTTLVKSSSGAYPRCPGEANQTFWRKLARYLPVWPVLRADMRLCNRAAPTPSRDRR